MTAPALFIAIPLLCACAPGPADWAEDTEKRLECGMNVAQVKTISGREVEAQDVPVGWMTHMIRDGSTELWLGFKDNKLRWTQVKWAQKPMKTAMYQRRDLCGP